MLTNILIALSLSLVNSPVLGQKVECGGGRPPFVNIFDVGDNYCECNFPPNIFKVSCLLTSCPSLTGLCPLTRNRSINQTALTSAVSILNQCIGKNGLICNFNMSRTSMAPISWTTAQLIPPSMVNGTVVHIPGTGYVANFSKATFTLQQNENPITLTIRVPNFFGDAYYNCTFNFPSTSILRSLKGILPALTLPDTSLNTPNMRGILRVNVTSTVSFNLTTPTPTIKTIDQQSDINLVFSNFVNASGTPLEQNYAEAFNEGMNMFGKRSTIPGAIIDFLSSYAAIGLQAAQLNCS